MQVEKVDCIEEASETVVYPKCVLRNINLSIAEGELCAVVGRVASGKSTLCSAILNEAYLNSGEISLNGKAAYAAQSPWVSFFCASQKRLQ